MKLNQQAIKQGNLKKIYGLISRGENMSRAKLAALTKLSKTTVSILVDELILGGYIEDTGVQEDVTLGRRPSLLRVKAEDNVVAVIAWHSHYFKAALVDTAGEITEEFTCPFDGGAEPVAQLLEVFEGTLLPACEDRRVLGICVVVPGLVDKYTGQIYSTIVDGEPDKPILEALRKAFAGYPLCVFNDTACYSYAELVTSGIEERNFVFVNMSRGVGALMYSGGAMLRSASGMTTQFGHFSVDRHGPQCACGNRGCLEQMIGEGALPRRIQELGLQELFDAPGRATFAELGELHRRADPRVEPLMASLAEDLAFGLANLITLFHPYLVVIGGSGRALGDKYLRMVREALQGMGFAQFTQGIPLRFSQVDIEAELQGAAQYFLDRHFAFDETVTDKIIL